MHLKDILTKQCIIGTIGVIIAVLGALFAIFWKDLFTNILFNEMVLSPKSRSYEPWKSPPVDLYLDIYLFNWTNADDFSMNSTVKPNFVELGPYRFREYPDKVDMKWHEHNSTVTYRKQSMFFFDAAGSNGSLDDMVTSVNVVALSAAGRARYWNFVGQKTVSIGLTAYKQKVHVTKVVREMLFEGYEDDMISFAKEMPAFMDAGEIPFDRVGWFYMRNNTPDLTGYFNVHTGASEIKNIGKIMNWNFANRTNFFEGNCGLLNGSAGELFPPSQLKQEPISLFTPDMCRSIPFDFVEEVNIQDIVGYKYAGGPRTVDNGTLFPENQCFCGGECVPSGVLNISSCRFGTPVFMSFPHFFNADPFYTNQIDGLKPVKENHEFYMILEPTTGLPLEVAARFQLNLLIRPSEHIAVYQDVKETYMPILWFEQKVKINEATAADIKLALNMPTTGKIAGIVVLVAGLIMMIWYPLDKLYRRKRQIKPSDSSDINKAVNKNEVSPLLITNGFKVVEITSLKDNNIKKSMEKLDSGKSEKLETNVC